MKQRVFNITLIIALVASMCVITAAPALAIPAAVKDLTVSFTPNEANKPVTIEVSFTTVNSLSSSTGKIFIELPDECYIPASIAPENVRVQTGGGSFKNSDGVAIADHTLEVDIPAYIGANTDVVVVVLESAGVLNPHLSQERNNEYPTASNLHPAIDLLNSFAHLYGDTAADALYDIRVWTSTDTLVAISSKFEIFDWIEIDKYDFGKGDIVNVTGAGFTPGDTFTLNKDTNQPLIGNCIVQPDGTIDIQANVAQKIPLIPLQGTDESGRASNILWSKCSMMTDAVYMVSFSSVYPMMGNPTMSTWIKPEGVWHLIPSVDIPAPVLPGSEMTIFGFDWGEVNDITISGPVTDPAAMPVLQELDTDCYCMPARFTMPGEVVPMADLQLYIGGKLEMVGGLPVARGCSEIPEPVDGPGCADDFMVVRPVPRTIAPGTYQVTVSGADQMNEQHVVAEGDVMGSPVDPVEYYVSMNYVRCFLEILFGDPATAQAIIDAMNASCCNTEYGSGYPCGPPCQMNPNACVDCEVNVVSEFVVPAPEIVVPATVCKGGMIDLTGSGFAPGENFGRAWIYSGSPEEIATGITVNGQGEFVETNVMIPVDPGTHMITVFFDPDDPNFNGDPDEIFASAVIEVLDCGTPATCSLTLDSTDGGSVITPGEATHFYDCGTVVPIEAEADPSYNFIGWTGSGSPMVADTGSISTTILLDDNYTLTANFAGTPTACSLTINSGTCGQVLCPGTGTHEYTCGTLVPIEVEYYDCTCCVWDEWAGDTVTIDEPDAMITTILVDGDYTIEPVFDISWCAWEYDHNHNCDISYGEMVNALMDYLIDNINFGQMVKVLMEYLTP